MKAPLVFLTLVSFIITSLVGPLPQAYANEFNLPAPGVIVHLSPPLEPAILKGIKVHPENPFRFEFILDKGDSFVIPAKGGIQQQEQLKQEAAKLIKYFLASLTIPEKDLWVNLSPYEKDRIIPQGFGLTEMGRDLLAEDYMLKQITASLIYPEDKIGKEFWRRIYDQAAKKFGTTNIPVNTFNKVWIVPEKAVVYENAKAGTAYVVESKLKVMLEQDYLSMSKHQRQPGDMDSAVSPSTQLIRAIIIPELNREVNEGKNFAQLRQVYNSLILATWYKKKIKDSILEQVYLNRRKTAGINNDDPTETQKIYQRYLQAFKKGVFNYIKEDLDPSTQETIPRKYFSGGTSFDDQAMLTAFKETTDAAVLSSISTDSQVIVQAGLTQIPNASGSKIPFKQDLAMNTQPLIGKITLSGQMRTKLSQILEKSRNMIYSGQADLWDEQFYAYAREQGINYVRLTLKNDEDLDRLKNDVIFNEDGTYQIRPDGPLIKVLKEGGILLIDYNGSAPGLVEGFNSLFDPKPYYDGIQEVSTQLKIVGIMSPDNLKKYSSAFHDRMVEQAVKEEGASQLPALPELTKSEFDSMPDADIVDLWEAPLSRELLIGDIRSKNVEGNFRLGVIEGALARAKISGKPVVIRGAGMARRDVESLLHDIRMKGSLRFNGEDIELPSSLRVFIYDPPFNEGVTKKIEVAKEGKNEHVWILNGQTQDYLLSIPQVDQDGNFNILPGLLEQAKAGPVNLRVTGNLERWVWHRIMHSPDNLKIEVLPNVKVPSEYVKFLEAPTSEKQNNFPPKTWEETAGKPVIVLQSQDTDAGLELIRQREGQDVLVYDITPETTMADLTSAIYKKPGWKFDVKERQLWRALTGGQTVVLNNAQNNPLLLEELQTLFMENPYLMVNGQRQTFPGRVYVNMLKGGVRAPPTAENFVDRDITDDQKAEILQTLVKQFDPLQYEKIVKLKNLLKKSENIPPELRQQLATAFDLPRLQLMLGYDNLLEGIESVLIAPFYSTPETVSFLKVMARLALDEDYPQQTPNSIDRQKLFSILNHLPPEISWDEHFWSLADTLSLDLLKNEQVVSTASSHKVFALIKKALVRNETEAQDFYRWKFDISEDVSNAPELVTIENESDPVKSSVKAMSVARALMFIGQPGVGKTYTASRLYKKLGYEANEVFGPLTVGADVKEEDVLSRQKIIDEQTQDQDELIAQWARRKSGGILIVDEGNLPAARYWSFLRGVFDKKPHVWIKGERVELSDRHKIDFTGNGYEVVGRKHQEIIDRYAITIPFEPLNREQMESIIKGEGTEEGPYLLPTTKRTDELINRILDIHEIFERFAGHGQFSLRDIQAVCERLNIFNKDGWNIADLVGHAWDIYKGHFSAEQQEAIRQVLNGRFGVDVVKISSDKDKKIRNLISGHEAYKNLALVNSTVSMIRIIQDFLKIRAVRMNNESQFQAKRAIILEGPSGRGKDVTTLSVLKDLGVDFISINASVMSTDAIINAIEDAKKTGKIVHISEPNLLPSAFLEGKLNDALNGQVLVKDPLTGEQSMQDPHPGFGVIMTMNSDDFSGRQKLSSALLNRAIYEQVTDYNEEDLMEFADFYSQNTASPQQIRYAVKAHLWIADQIKSKQHKPTPRRLMAVLDMVRQGIDVKAAVDIVYGQLYLGHLLGGIKLPDEKTLLTYKTQNLDKVKVLEYMARALIPQALGPVTIERISSNTKSGSHRYVPGQGTVIQIGQDELQGQGWQNVIWHESSHGRYTRFWEKFSDFKLKELYDDLEDIRHLAALKKDFPFAPAEDELLDFNTWFELQTRTPRDVFRYLLLLKGHGRLSLSPQVEQKMAQGMGISSQELKEALDAVVKLLTCISTSQNEEEIQRQQYKAVILMKQISKIYKHIMDIPAIQEAPAPLKEIALNDIDLTPELPKAPETKEVQPIEPVDMKAALVKSILSKFADELSLIKEDLQAGAENSRLEEMGKQLSDENAPHSVKAMLQQLKNMGFDTSELEGNIQDVQNDLNPPHRFAQGLLKGINLSIPNWVARRPMLLRSLNAVLNSLGMEIGIAGISERLNSGIGPRYEGIHLQGDRQQDIVQVLTKSEPMPIKVRTTFIKGPLSNIVNKAQDEFKEQIEEFMQYYLAPDGQYGPVGTIKSATRFINNPARGLFRSASRQEEAGKKTIYISDYLGSSPARITEACLTFLEDQGFKLEALYDRFDASYVESHFRPDQYVIISMADMQKKFEEFLLYHAFKSELLKSPIYEQPQASKAQLDLAKEALNEYKNIMSNIRYKVGRFSNISNDNQGLPYIFLFLNANSMQRSPVFSGPTQYVESISVLGPTAYNPQVSFEEFKNLRYLNLKDVGGISMDQIYTILSSHPNYENLEINLPGGKKVIKFNDLPPKYKAKVNRLEDQQVERAKEILANNGLKDISGNLLFGVNLKGKMTFMLNLSSLRPEKVDWSGITALTYLTELMLPVTKPNAEIWRLILANPKLERLHLHGFDAGAQNQNLNQLYELIKNHPNIKNLKVYIYDDIWGSKTLTYHSIPAELQSSNIQIPQAQEQKHYFEFSEAQKQEIFEKEKAYVLAKEKEGIFKNVTFDGQNINLTFVEPDELSSLLAITNLKTVKLPHVRPLGQGRFAGYSLEDVQRLIYWHPNKGLEVVIPGDPVLNWKVLKANLGNNKLRATDGNTGLHIIETLNEINKGSLIVSRNLKAYNVGLRKSISLDPLLGIADIHDLEIPNGEFFLRQAQDFLSRHVNRVKIFVIQGNGEFLSYSYLPIEVKRKAPPLTFEEQKELIKNTGYEPAFANGTGHSFDLDYKWVSDRWKLEFLYGFTNVRSLKLPQIALSTGQDVEIIKSMTGLQELDVKDAPDNFIEDIYKQHPNLNLKIYNGKGGEFLRDKYYKSEIKKFPGNQFLEELVNDLVDQKGTLEKVRQRFEAEGQLEAFNNILAGLSLHTPSPVVFAQPMGITATSPKSNNLFNPSGRGPNIKGSDEAQLTTKGGIDLTPEKMNLQTNNSAGSIQFHLNPAQLTQLQNTPGFTPTIINIQPLTNLESFLCK